MLLAVALSLSKRKSNCARKRISSRSHSIIVKVVALPRWPPAKRLARAELQQQQQPALLLPQPLPRPRRRMHRKAQPMVRQLLHAISSPLTHAHAADAGTAQPIQLASSARVCAVAIACFQSDVSIGCCCSQPPLRAPGCPLTPQQQQQSLMSIPLLRSTASALLCVSSCSGDALPPTLLASKWQ